MMPWNYWGNLWSAVCCMCRSVVIGGEGAGVPLWAPPGAGWRQDAAGKASRPKLGLVVDGRERRDRGTGLRPPQAKGAGHGVAAYAMPMRNGPKRPPAVRQGGKRLTKFFGRIIQRAIPAFLAYVNSLFFGSRPSRFGAGGLVDSVSGQEREQQEYDGQSQRVVSPSR